MMKLLSLTGGGIRGIYTAEVLRLLENTKKQHDPGFELYRHADIITGTSIGGIIALGLAAGCSLEVMVEQFKKNGKNIFPFCASIANRLKKPPFDPAEVRKVVEQVFAESHCPLQPDATLAELETDIVVTCFAVGSGELVLLNNKQEPYRNWRIIDAALATSAAPTYFPSFSHNNEKYIDGGVACNMPDMIVINFMSTLYDISPEQINTLSIGTTYPGRNAASWLESMEEGREGLYAWFRKHEGHLIDVLMHAQSSLNESLFKHLTGRARRIRIDRCHGDTEIPLDDASDEAISKLLALAENSTNAPAWNAELNAWLN